MLFFFFQDRLCSQCQVSLLCFKKLSHEAAVEHCVNAFYVFVLFLYEQTLCPGQTSPWGHSCFNQSVWNQFKFSEVNLISEICLCVCRYLSKRQHHWEGTASSTKTGAGQEHPIIHYSLTHTHTHTHRHTLDYYKSFVSNLTTDPTLTLLLTTLKSSGLRWASQFLYLHVLCLSPESHTLFYFKCYLHLFQK